MFENRVFGVFGEQRNRGLELSVFGTPARGLKLLGGLTLIDAEQRVTAGGVNQGKKAIGRAETQLNIGADWIVPGVDGLSLNARTVYTSKQYADGANLQKLPSWTRLDLGATWNTRFMDRDLTLRARGQRHGQELLGLGRRISGRGLPGAGGAAQRVGVGDGRLLSITAGAGRPSRQPAPSCRPPRARPA
ncbi:TonB-dependent receptor domain-containing protein [Massilia oculi]|uniref:TonB-dependent receptor domain-containing protein n=1 Tax=Massilia oculi TaxID=945844 RepID=UPI0036139F54